VASSIIFVGVKGNVIALDRTNGGEIWRTELSGADFVNLVVDGDLIIAATRGEVFGLDAATGTKLWQNGLPGMGWGLVSVATTNGASSNLSPIEKKRRDDAAAASTSAVG
jgi:outer membrane protein assembly factor BamB